MSGHSKWSKVKHQKEASDEKRGKIFTKLAAAISVAVRQGGGEDPSVNFKLRLAIEKARSMNMPKEKIDRAIERGKGGTSEAHVEEVLYEAFGPGGVGLIIECATDNRQRSVAEVKNTLERHGGVLAAKGSVAHMFAHVGCLKTERKDKTEEQILSCCMDSGALDWKMVGDAMEIFTDPADLHRVKDALESSRIPVSSADLVYRPTTTVALSPLDANRLRQVRERIEDSDDVQRVFTNYEEIPDVSSQEANVSLVSPR